MLGFLIDYDIIYLINPKNRGEAMGVKYILGRSGTGKTTYILKEIREKIIEKKQQKLILLVPEQFTLQAERDLLEKQDLEGIMEAEVLSFSRLAYQVFNEVGGLTQININDIGKNMVIRKLLEELGKDLTIYQKTARQEGFVLKINELISEMKQHDILPEELKLLDTLKEEPLLRLKLKDFSLLYEYFNRYLENAYLDTEDHINLLIEKIKDTKFLNDAEIWIDGFHYMTPQTLRIIAELMKKARQINIALTLDPNPHSREGDLFAVTEGTLKQIRHLAQHLEIREEQIILTHQKEIKPPQLAHVEREIYAYPYRSYEGRGNEIEIFSAANLYTEIEQVAGQILSLVRDQGYRFKDIAIVSGDLNSYSMIIKRVFQEYEIPCFMDEKRDIMDHPLVELILAAIDIVSRGFQYEDVFRFLKTGFSDLSKDEIEELENYGIAYGIRGSQWEKEFTKGQDEDLGRLNQIRSQFYQPLGTFKENVKKAGSVLEITKGLFNLLQQMKMEEKLEDWIEKLKELGRYDSVNENTQIWNTVMAIFDQLSEILGDRKISLKEYKKVLESGFGACEIGVIPATVDQVLVGNLDRSRSHDIKALFVVGVNDGILPSLREEEGLLSDQERQLLKEHGITLAVYGEGRLAEEKLAIYMALSKPSQYLWLSYAAADQEGRALRPSIIIDRFKKLFPKIHIKSDLVKVSQDSINYVATPTSTFKYLVENMRLKLDEKECSDLWWKVLAWYHDNPEWHKRKDLMVKGLFHENQIHYIPNTKARELYQTPIHTSISRLERFSNCPFSHMVAYGLKPRERKEYQLKSPDIGRLFHYSLELFGRYLQAERLEWRELERQQCEQIVDTLIDGISETFENGILNSTHRYRYMVNRLKRISKRALWTLTNHLKSGNFNPMGHEIQFSNQEGATLPAIIIELEDGEEIFLQGVIDRVDVYTDETGQYINIIDYKSGNRDFSLSDAYYGLQLQLLVYMDAVLSVESFKNVKLYPGGIFYFKIDDPLIKTTDLASEHIEREINKALKLRGMVLKDLKVIKNIDIDIDGSSDIIPVRLNKGDEISKTSSVLTAEDFRSMLNHIRHIIKEISREILKGNVKILPCKKGKQVSCQYCQYQSICQFDGLLEDNVYRIIKELKDEEILDKLKIEGEVLADA